jgi:hypothetical protein
MALIPADLEHNPGAGEVDERVESPSIARNKSPLPRKTVAKKAILKLSQAVAQHGNDHKKAMPANGIRLRPRAVVLALVLSQAPASSGSARTESRNK